MPVCVDCERWSPGTFKRCPDCSGALKLEPPWARSSKDSQLARLDDEAKWWHRRAREGGSAHRTEAEAWAIVADRRHRYEELRRRLLPVLEATEASRVERLQAGAQAEGMPVHAYAAKVAREQREREQAAERTSRSLRKALEGGQITRGEYEKREAQAQSERREELARVDAAAASAEGLSVSAYRSRTRREWRKRERLWGGEQAWLGDPGGWSEAWFTSLLAIPIIGVVGLILVGVFVVTGRSPLAAIAGTAVGGLAGWLLAQLVFFGTWVLMDRVAKRSWLIRRIGEPVLSVAFLGIFIVPPVLVILAALRLN